MVFLEMGNTRKCTLYADDNVSCIPYVTLVDTGACFCSLYE